jgi:hypothetical protein
MFRPHAARPAQTPQHWIAQEEQWRAKINKLRERDILGEHGRASSSPAASSSAIAHMVEQAGFPSPQASPAVEEPRGAAPLWSRTFAEAELEDRIRAAAQRAAFESAPSPSTAATYYTHASTTAAPTTTAPPTSNAASATVSLDAYRSPAIYKPLPGLSKKPD